MKVHELRRLLDELVTINPDANLFEVGVAGQDDSGDRVEFKLHGQLNRTMDNAGYPMLQIR
jgi:hypothetical protein